MSSHHHSKNIIITCFLTEVWERYGFYVIQSLLALYLALYNQLPDYAVYSLVGSFTGLTYISPILGGFIADRYLGQQYTVLLGAVILLLGYIGIAFAQSMHLLLFALSVIAIGTGLLKPNISAILGKQYASAEHYRNSGFTLFYLGITIGIILGTLLPSQLQHYLGWRVCFLSAALALLIAFFVFYWGSRKFPTMVSTMHTLTKSQAVLCWGTVLIGLVVASVIFYTVFLYTAIASLFFLVVILISAAIGLRIAYEQNGAQRDKTIVLLLLFIIATGFWSFYFQIFMSMTLLIHRTVAPSIWGIHFPAPYYVAVQSVGMVVLGLGLSKLWKNIQYKNKLLAVGKKFSAALVCLLLSYSIVLWAIYHYPADSFIAIWPVVSAFLVISLAELLLSPIGLAAVSRFSSAKHVSTLMGLFFVSLGAGGFIAGQLSKLTNVASSSLVQLKIHYIYSFRWLIAILMMYCMLSLIICFFIKRISERIASYE